MKKIAILVIAATNKPVYEFYIRNYWTDLIHYTKSQAPHIDVFLLFEKKFCSNDFSKIQDNIIRDDTTDLFSLCDSKFQSPQTPGILSKTVYALEQLQDDYDVFFRTNLSSVIRLSIFDNLVQTKKSICYSGSFIWKDLLRDDLQNHNRIGIGKSIESLSQIENYPGNTFISGSGFFLNNQEARLIVRNKHKLIYSIPDDVAIGLMLSNHELLPRFTMIIKDNTPLNDISQLIVDHPGCHIRLQHLPLGIAQGFWQRVKTTNLWR